MGTFGGRYEALADERGFEGSKVGGQLALELPCEVPACRSCGQPMRFMLQVFFEPGFYEPYKAAVVFICGEPYGPDFKLRCETYDPFAGANAVVLLKEIVSAEPSGPPPAAEVDRRHDPISPPYRVSWEEWPDFTYRPDQNDYSDTEEHRIVWAEIAAFLERFGWNKRGGYAMFEQTDDTPTCPACGGPVIFAAQFSADLPIGMLEEFGDVGTGYVFLCKAKCGDRGGAFLWQCG
jgi:hypothetical protein